MPQKLPITANTAPRFGVEPSMTPTLEGDKTVWTHDKNREGVELYNPTLYTNPIQRSKRALPYGPAFEAAHAMAQAVARRNEDVLGIARTPA